VALRVRQVCLIVAGNSSTPDGDVAVGTKCLSCGVKVADLFVLCKIIGAVLAG